MQGPFRDRYLRPVGLAALDESVLRGSDPASGQDELNSRIRRHYDRYGDIYDFYQTYFYDWFQQRAWWAEVEFIRKRVARKPLHVLDLGCGTGHLALKFRELGSHVAAVDLSGRMLEVLSRKAETYPKGVLLPIVADVREFVETTPATFDVVCESSVLHHVFDYEGLVRAMARKVRPGGILYLTRELLAPAEIRDLDPLRRAVSTVLERLYRRLLRQMIRARFFSHLVRPPDLSRISANFYERGVSLQVVRKATTEEGLREVSLRRFNERENGLLSMLDNRIFRAFRRERFQKTFYSLILERPASPE